MINGTRYRLSTEIHRQQRLATDIAHAQAQISTRKRLQAPSDNPPDAAQIARITRSLGNEAAWTQNITAASTLASRGDEALRTLASGYDRALELMLNASTGTASAENRETIAVELRSLADEVRSLRDSADGRGGKLFSTGEPVAIPIGESLEVAPVNSRAAVFDTVVTPSGTTDLAAILDAAVAAITNPDDAARAAAIETSLAAVTAATDHIANMRGDQGIRGARIDSAGERLAASTLTLKEEFTSFSETDIVEVTAQLNSKQLSLEAAQAVFARLNQNSLFDLLL